MGSALVTHLLHARLRVPDPEEAAAYYQRSLGLVRVGSDSGPIRLSVAPRDAVVVSSGDIVLERGDDPGLAGLAFGVSSVDDLGRVRRALRDGASNGYGLLQRDPDGCPVEIAVPEPPRRRPAVARAFSFAKLGHVTRRSPNPPAQARWWQETLGFRPVGSDRGDLLLPLRCNRDHHAVAFVQGPNWTRTTSAWSSKSWARPAARGRTPRRHGDPDRVWSGPPRTRKNIFDFLDRWGIRWGAFCELERIDDENHVPGHWKGGRRDTVNLWGPVPPESYFS